MRHTCFIAALVLLNLAIFAQTVHFDFVDYDDNTYVIDNEHLEDGLTLQNIAWGLTSGYFVNWHPVTWWSYLADYELYGRQPGGYHFTNVLIHILAAIALYAALFRMTGAYWPSVVVTLFFAVHPQHVQSVAWISERKDVLSGLFLGLTFLAYHQYTRKPTLPRYLLTALVFGFGLMSKPMLVTLPCVLFLLDYWPLNRLETREAVRRAVFEKLPLLAMSFGAALTTMLLQEGGGAAATAERFGIFGRIANAVHAYGMYLFRTVWPVNLSYFYPLDVDALPYAEAGISLVALLIITALALWLRKTEPAVIVGWLWYLGTLVPVVGLVQVGSQASADRYTYIPLIGVFIAVVFPLASRFSGSGAPDRAIQAVAAMALLACSALAYTETRAWENTDTLTADALDANPDNYLAVYMRALMLEEQGDTEQAEALVRRSVEILPRHMAGHIKLGMIERERGNMDAAIARFSEGLDGHPRTQLQCHLALADTYYEAGDNEKAADHFNEALELDPENASAHIGVAQILLDRGRADDARTRLNALLAAYPDSYETHYNLGRVAALSGNADRAREHYLTAFGIDADGIENLINLANVQAQTDRLESALILYARALRLRPDDATLHTNRAAALYGSGRYAEALESVERALELEPELELGHRLQAALQAEMATEK